MKTSFLSTNYIHRTLGRSALLSVLLLLACFALSPRARAVCQEGCDTNQNTALGDAALVSNTTGTENTAIGASALSMNIAGFYNTASGSNALHSNITSYQNTATGAYALYSNTTGIQNTASGAFALWMNTAGFYNTASGSNALRSNTTGSDNTASGLYALYTNTTGYHNAAIGSGALFSNATGSNNIALGFNAGFNLTTGSDNIDIGNVGVAGESSHIRIGTAGTQTAAFIAGIRGTAIIGGIPVGVSSSGQLGVAPSSQRFKQNIQPMADASEAILALKPVTFRYKKELDREGIPQFGLVAEQVEKVNPDLVARDEQGKPYTVRYEAVNAMLLNEFLKERRIVQEQQATIHRLQAAVAQQRKDFESTAAQQQEEIKALSAGLQRVSAQLERNQPGPRILANNR